MQSTNGVYQPTRQTRSRGEALFKMVAQEHTMSHSKREQSEFHHAVAAGRCPAQHELLRRLESNARANVNEDCECWNPGNSVLSQSGDPYNGIGARVLAGRDLRK